ncbi:cytochrome P450 [Exophiala viscosa]|uniref:Cytochrome P450 n=1 Tax=Exophiala viscosa TaxID=2486360 RepID=A0AAN6DSB7_9EURO|nr:cytochrome P450 [Exophiala viscosa]
MLRLITAIVALLIAGAAYFVRLLYQKRRELEGLPHPPMESIFWGHLPIAGECRTLFPPMVHVQSWANYIRKKYDLGDVFYVDWWPLGPRWLFVADPELTSKYITTGQSLRKSHLTTNYLRRLLGKLNMVTMEGQQWKFLRSIYNPGFSASHLVTLVPYIVDSTVVFLDILREKARTNELIKLDFYSTRYTIDIIGKIVMETDFDSQTRDHPIVTTFRKQVEMMPVVTSGIPLLDFRPLNEIRLWRNERKLDALIGAEIDKRIALRNQERQSGQANASGTKDRKRSILDLAIEAYDKETSAVNSTSRNSSTNHLMTSFRTTAIDSVKTFIFAGHDTTSATISYTMYLLHLHPEVHGKLIAELNSVFGSDTMSTSTSLADAIKRDPHALNKLEYMSAVIKEVLRLFPPASTLREWSAATGKEDAMFDPKTGQTYPLKGWDLWPVATMIHRNDDFFPDPVKFVPERFLPTQTPYPDAKLHTPAGKDAWRPFEKGPRNCIGQELAMLETKIAFSLVLPELDFTAEYDGKQINEGDWVPVETRDEYKDGRPGVERMTIEGHKPYQVLLGAARPRDGMTGRLSLRR